MSKELAQTVGGKRVAWLIALLAAFAVMAALGSQWRTSSASVTGGDWQITGPWVNNNCTGAAPTNFTGTATVFYCITLGPGGLTGTYQPPLDLTINAADPDVTFTGVTNIVAGGPATCSGSGGSVTCTFGSLAGGPPYTVAYQATVNGDVGGGNAGVTGIVNDADIGQPPQAIPAANNLTNP